MRHRGPAQRGQVHAFQRADQSRHRRRELPLLHHRAQHRRGGGAGPAPGAAGRDREARARAARHRRVRRHRRPGGRCQPGRGPGQPVPGAHPRDRRHRQRGALLRGRQRHPRGRQGRSDRRHRGDPDRAVPGRPGHGRESRAALHQGRQERQRQGSRRHAQGAGPGAGRAERGEAGAHAAAVEGRAGAAQAPVPDHRQAGHVRRQRERGRVREQPAAGPPEGLRRRPERPRGRHLRQDGSRHGRDERPGQGHLPGGNGPDRAGPEPPDPRRLQAAGPADLLHRRREGGARLDHPHRRHRAAGGGRDPRRL